MALWIFKKRKENQKQFRSNFNEMTRVKWEHKSEETIHNTKNTIHNLNVMSYQLREKVIILFDDYTTIVYKDKYEAKNRKGLKMLTPTQMLQRQPITLAQVKAGNTSENLFNKIRQIMYSLY